MEKTFQQDHMEQPKIIKEDGYHYKILFEGKEYTIRELAEELNVTETSITSAARKVKDMRLWILKKRYLVSKGYNSVLAVYTDGVFFITGAEIVKATGICTSQAIRKGQKFSEGKITKEELMRPLTRKQAIMHRGQADWKGLSSKKREYNLKKIVKPGTWEKKHLNEDPLERQDGKKGAFIVHRLNLDQKF